ncbi:MAG: histidine triad nucleotide-binding protein [Chloroflexi bacterium]|nr:MAG: histidine triad nucleotide-binding protein [Chloroflexota bacterium]
MKASIASVWRQRPAPANVSRTLLMRYCVFCEIIAHKAPAEILFEDDEVIVFRNRLGWVPTMLLSVPKKHLTQAELWSNLGRVGEIAVRMGQEHCPAGFRLLSNFGHDAMQSQEHGHIHVLGGVFLGEYA